MRPGDTLSLRIEKPAAGGWMIARSNGQVILVSGVVPHEQAAVYIDRVAKGVAYGHATTIEDPSPDRRPPFVDPACGGCLYAHITYARQLAIKSQVIADALARIGRLTWSHPIAVAASPDEGYRMRSRLHVRAGRIGFFREATHELCDARSTRQLLPETCDVIDELARRLQVGKAISGELELSENIEATDRVAHFEHSSPLGREDWIDATTGLRLTGVTLSDSRQAAGRSTVLGGDPHVTDVFSVDGHEVRLRRHVQAFFQGNRYLLRELVAHIVGQVDVGDEVVDLYAGAGLFSLSAAIARGALVTAVEGDRFAAADLTANAAAATATAGAVAAVHEPVETFVRRQRKAPAVLIVDPPRTGMSKEALAGTIQMNARKVVYVSCDVATLARDARRFVDAGYDVEAITAFDLFPNTPHVETVAVLRRRAEV
jgi:23S rRNA (uracil1939-C5)-methyltransferase